jgi:hypothetical protein
VKVTALDYQPIKRADKIIKSGNLHVMEKHACVILTMHSVSGKKKNCLLNKGSKLYLKMIGGTVGLQIMRKSTLKAWTIMPYPSIKETQSTVAISSTPKRLAPRTDREDGQMKQYASDKRERDCVCACVKI